MLPSVTEETQRGYRKKYMNCAVIVTKLAKWKKWEFHDL